MRFARFESCQKIRCCIRGTLTSTRTRGVSSRAWLGLPYPTIDAYPTSPVHDTALLMKTCNTQGLGSILLYHYRCLLMCFRGNFTALILNLRRSIIIYPRPPPRPHRRIPFVLRVPSRMHHFIAHAQDRRRGRLHPSVLYDISRRMIVSKLLKLKMFPSASHLHVWRCTEF